ncbi:hypothetical protein JCM17844_11670 [Iodidimonas gelatinilytica]|uniref:L,D-TPase catalytic domain-containing protein n=1 Tax=Iodidimonas gelatinilytica TaxID=1236966 RepID=A0A5A7MNG4_9PROT|nr:L,D-transpeptidase family protein [Iodidimonas gelatinilytica]GEQ97530.1 hypothetical protein JCM17844_11670 [Iodidimonas gelatinilytica]
MSDDVIFVRAPAHEPRGVLRYRGMDFPCALGSAGIVAASKAQEGDRATPAGRYRLESGFYRADRMARPRCALDLHPTNEAMGWCDAPHSPQYNQLVTRPFPESHERLMRDDSRYDLLLVIGFNRLPVVLGRGSAIFLHMTDDQLSHTMGCVALRPDDLLALAARLTAASVIDIGLDNDR